MQVHSQNFHCSALIKNTHYWAIELFFLFNFVCSKIIEGIAFMISNSRLIMQTPIWCFCQCVLGIMSLSSRLSSSINRLAKDFKSCHLTCLAGIKMINIIIVLHHICERDSIHKMRLGAEPCRKTFECPNYFLITM